MKNFAAEHCTAPLCCRAAVFSSALCPMHSSKPAGPFTCIILCAAFWETGVKFSRFAAFPVVLLYLFSKIVYFDQACLCAIEADFFAAKQLVFIRGSFFPNFFCPDAPGSFKALLFLCEAAFLAISFFDVFGSRESAFSSKMRFFLRNVVLVA